MDGVRETEEVSRAQWSENILENDETAGKVEIINDQYPPNIEEIAAAFPLLSQQIGPVFAYGDRIYVPDGGVLPAWLLAHEIVHCMRQQEMGVEAWWNRYFIDREFRYNEELLAHTAEYQHYISKTSASRQQKRAALKIAAKRLANPLYRTGVSTAKARADIKKGVSNGENT